MRGSGEMSPLTGAIPSRCMPKRATFDPAQCFALYDIALWSTSLTRHSEYQADMHAPDGIVQTMRSTKPELFTGTIEGNSNEITLLRTLVSLGLRSILPEGEQRPETIVLFALEATFSVEYVVEKAPSEEDFQSFVELNCVHNAWPFWRQHVYDTLKRASLPVPTIPLFSGKKSSRKRSKLKSLQRVLPSSA